MNVEAYSKLIINSQSEILRHRVRHRSESGFFSYRLHPILLQYVQSLSPQQFFICFRKKNHISVPISDLLFHGESESLIFFFILNVSFLLHLFCSRWPWKRHTNESLANFLYRSQFSVGSLMISLNMKPINHLMLSYFHFLCPPLSPPFLLWSDFKLFHGFLVSQGNKERIQCLWNQRRSTSP